MSSDGEVSSVTATDSITPEERTIALPREVRVINVGLSRFADAVRDQGVEVIDVDWRIPAGGNAELIAALARLYGPHSRAIDEANRQVVRRLDEGVAVLIEVAPAARVIPGIGERTVLHPGPPLDWADFCDPLRRSVRAAVMAEGWASTPEEAERVVAGDNVQLEPANHHATVVPMATALTPSAPVFVVENPQGGNRAYSTLNQGPGKVAWFGVEQPEAVERLRWLRDVAAPVLSATLQAAGPIDLFSIAAQGLQMGDDGHMRTQAATNLLVRHLLPSLVGLEDPRRVEVARFFSANHLFFLNLGMAAAKAIADWASEIAGSSVVTGMARNGTTFGIRLGSIAQRRSHGTSQASRRNRPTLGPKVGSQASWFVATAPKVGDALFYSGFGPEVGAPDIGDSAVLELVGLGGAAAAASPAIASFLGGSMAQAVATTEEMDRICVSSSSRFKLPFLDFRGSPLGIDVRKVVELEIAPAINTGILHASEGVGQIGAGVARAPLDCFRQALLALDEFYCYGEE